MARITLELDDEVYEILYELQLERRKDKHNRTALNHIASDLLTEKLKALKKESPGK